MRILILILTLSLFSYLFHQEADAKTLPQAKSSKTSVGKKSSGTGITVSPRLRSDRRALFISFGNLQNAKSVSYTLMYTTNGQDEGAGGSLTLDGSGNATRELLFGTCSKNICRYHVNITNARLEVGYTSTVGKKFLKRYRIKI